MKKSIYLLIFISITSLALGQENENRSKADIFLIDSITNGAIVSATVNLIATKGSFSKAAISDKGGHVLLDSIPVGDYELFCSIVGYKSVRKAVTVNSSTLVDTIILVPNSKLLENVVVRATKPLIKVDIDQLTYEVDSDPESKFLNLLDLMRKVPMLSVDANDNLKLKGSSSFRIFLNGKPSSMFAHSTKEVLKSIPASSIQKIEVITNPPAKYDGEGLAGIINIVLKKRVIDGYNGSVSLRYAIPSGPGSSYNFSVKKGKFGLTLTGVYSSFKSPEGNTQNERVTTDPYKSRLIQTGTTDYRGHFFTNDAELSYAIDSLNLLAMSINYNTEKSIDASDLNSLYYDGSNNIYKQDILQNKGVRKFYGYDISANYQRNFRNNSNRMLTMSYQFSKGGEKYNSQLLKGTDNSIVIPANRQFSHSNADENTIQIDYVTITPKKLKIELGAKAILRSNSSMSDNFRFNPDTLFSDNFESLQDVYSVYNSYTYKINTWAFKAGARYEYNEGKNKFISPSNDFSTDYGTILPNFAVESEIKKFGTLKLSFNRRIQRPNIYQLNPFVDESNPNSLSAGNPYLLPTYANNFDLGYSKFGKLRLFANIGYSISKNNVQRIISLINDSTTFSTYRNIGHFKSLNMNLNMMYTILKKINVNLNLGQKYLWLSGLYNNETISNNGFQIDATLNLGYTLKDSWRFGLTMSGWTGDVSLVGKGYDYFSTSMNISKNILKKKGSISLSVTNPYQRYSKFINTVNTPDVKQRNTYYYYSQRISVSFYYRFGKLKERFEGAERGINNDDLAPRKNTSSPL